MGKLKAAIRKKAQASTLVEVLVASIIFLTVFILSLEVSVRITSKQPVRADKYMLIQDQVEALRKHYTAGEYNSGTYYEQYEWGSVKIDISAYGEYDGINILELETEIPNTASNFKYRYLFENGF